MYLVDSHDPTLASVRIPVRERPESRSLKLAKVVAWTAVIGFTAIVLVLGAASVIALF